MDSTVVGKMVLVNPSKEIRVVLKRKEHSKELELALTQNLNLVGKIVKDKMRRQNNAY